MVTEADGTVTTKHVDLTFDQGVPVVHTYDANGNLESVAPQSAPGSPTRTYQWDAADRLVGITRIVNSTETYKTEFLYNGMGDRVGKRELLNGLVQSEIKYLYGGTGVLQERSADGGTVTKTYTSEGEQSYLTINNQPSTINLFYTRDHLGSVREVWDENGGLLARYDYTPYGERILVSGSHQSAKGYTGHDYDATSGLILTRYRAYDPGTGRWLSADPIGESGGMNLYGYVGNDPVNWSDPLGLSEMALNPGMTLPSIAGGLAGLAGAGGAIAVGGVGILGGITILAGIETWHEIQDAIEAQMRLDELLRGPLIHYTPVTEPTVCPADFGLPRRGTPGTIVTLGQTRRYGPDGWAEVDRDFPHGGGPKGGLERGDHVHDWDQPPGGGPPTRGEPRHPKPGDPPAPPGYSKS